MNLKELREQGGGKLLEAVLRHLLDKRKEDARRKAAHVADLALRMAPWEPVISLWRDVQASGVLPTMTIDDVARPQHLNDPHVRIEVAHCDAMDFPRPPGAGGDAVPSGCELNDVVAVHLLLDPTTCGRRRVRFVRAGAQTVPGSADVLAAGRDEWLEYFERECLRLMVDGIGSRDDIDRILDELEQEGDDEELNR